MDTFSLEGKTILITGASSGIGRCTAIECSSRGANLIILGRDKARLDETYDKLIGNSHRKYILDLNNDDDVVSFCEDVPALDGVVLCVGISQTVPVNHINGEIARRIFNTNFFSTVLFIQQLLKRKKISNNSSIVLISSVAQQKPYKGNGLYSASKAAINSYMRVMALELKSKRIRVNCIEPGIVRTEVFNKLVFTEDEMKNEEEKVPFGYGEPIDIANGCVFLLSNASKWVTGSSFVIDGGQTLL